MSNEIWNCAVCREPNGGQYEKCLTVGCHGRRHSSVMVESADHDLLAATTKVVRLTEILINTVQGTCDAPEAQVIALAEAIAQRETCKKHLATWQARARKRYV